MKRIALCGLFDLGDCIDTIGASVFCREITARNAEYEIDVYGMNNGDGIYSIFELEKNHLSKAYDAVVVSGNGIISLNKKSERQDACSSYMWTIPAMVSDKYKIKLVWNSISVGEDFEDSMLDLLIDAVNNVDYISTNNYGSLQRLCGMGIPAENVKYIPDSLVLISRCYDKEALAGAAQRICDEEYVVVNFGKGMNGDAAKSLKDKIVNIAKEKKVVLLPLYNSEGEDQFIHDYAAKLGKNVIAAKGDLSIEEFLYIISESSMVVTQNTALAACAYSYGVQAYIYDFESKFYDINDDLKKACDSHFDDIVKCLKSDGEVSSQSMINNMAVNYQNSGYKKIYADMANEITALKELVDALSYYKSSYEDLLGKYDADMEEKNNYISKLNRKIYDIENSKAYKMASRFIKE